MGIINLRFSRISESICFWEGGKGGGQGGLEERYKSHPLYWHLTGSKIILQIWHHYSPTPRGFHALFWYLLILQPEASFLAHHSSFPGYMFKKKKKKRPTFSLSQISACVIYRSNRLDWPSYKWERYITAGHLNQSGSLCQASPGFWSTTYDFQQHFYFFSPNSERETMCLLFLLLCIGGAALLPHFNLRKCCLPFGKAISRAYWVVHSSLDFLILQHNL